MKTVIRSTMTRSMLALPLLATVMSLGACASIPLPVIPVEQPMAAPEPPPPPPEVTKPEAPRMAPLKLPGPVVFATGSDRLSPESEPALKQVAAYLAHERDVTLLRIEGHTDNHGLRDQNQRLSEARALSVASWLVSNGVECKRLLPVGFGDTRPLADNGDEDGRSRNRRTMFFNAAVDGRALDRDPQAGGNAAGDPCSKR